MCVDDLDGGFCANSIGSYNCSCTAGFVGDGRVDQDGCADYDECAVGEDNCSVDAECINVPGTFECACKDGFTGDGVTCEDIDECADEHACDPLAVCTNRLGVRDANLFEFCIKQKVVMQKDPCKAPVLTIAHVSMDILKMQQPDFVLISMNVLLVLATVIPTTMPPARIQSALSLAFVLKTLVVPELSAIRAQEG